MAKTIEQQIAELDARRAELKKRQRERDKRARARADALLLRAVKNFFGVASPPKKSARSKGSQNSPPSKRSRKTPSRRLRIPRAPLRLQ